MIRFEYNLTICSRFLFIGIAFLRFLRIGIALRILLYFMIAIAIVIAFRPGYF